MEKGVGQVGGGCGISEFFKKNIQIYIRKKTTKKKHFFGGWAEWVRGWGGGGGLE